MTLGKHCVAVNHQFNRSRVASGHPWRDHLDWVNWSGKSIPDGGWHHPLGLGPRQLQRRTGAEHSSHTSLPPVHAVVWTPFMLCSCPLHTLAMIGSSPPFQLAAVWTPFTLCFCSLRTLAMMGTSLQLESEIHPYSFKMFGGCFVTATGNTESTQGKLSA